MPRLQAVPLLLAIAVLAGCGSSAGEPNNGKSEQALTVPAYGPFPAMTVPMTHGSDELCRAKADAFSRAAEAFLRPYPSDADNYRVLARVQFMVFKANQCNIGVLRKAISRRLTATQLHEVLSFFGFMGETARELEQSPQY